MTSTSPDLFDLLGTSEEPSLHEALLGRREHDVMSAGECRAFRGQRVLITGAAGFIGAALVRRIVRSKPAQLTLLDQSDSGLARLDMDLQRTKLPVNLVLGDVSRVSDVRNTIRDARPDVVFHAATAGRISVAERAVCATVRTNVFGTLHVARETAAAGARLVVISTHDTEAGATVVGATRRLAELVSVCPGHGFRPVIVRLGDVIEVPAGLVHGWLEQLRSGRKLVVPATAGPQALMNINEAVSLVLKADLLGAAGQVFRLDCGPRSEPTEIARRLLAWAAGRGITPAPLRVRSGRGGGRVVDPQTESGLVFASADGHARVQLATQRTPDTVMMSRILRALREDLRRHDALTALADLRAAIPGFLPSPAAREEAAASTLHLAMGFTWRPVQPLAAA